MATIEEDVVHEVRHAAGVIQDALDRGQVERAREQLARLWDLATRAEQLAVPARGQLCIWTLRVEESLSSRVSEERRWCVVVGVNGGVFARCPTEADAQRIVDRFEQEFRPWVRP